MKVIGRIRDSYNNILPPRITLRNEVSSHYEARWIGWDQASGVRTGKTNGMRMGWKLLARDRNAQLMTMTLSTSLRITLANCTCRCCF
jgi:hypothetical protein